MQDGTYVDAGTSWRGSTKPECWLMKTLVADISSTRSADQSPRFVGERDGLYHIEFFRGAHRSGRVDPNVAYLIGIRDGACSKRG